MNPIIETELGNEKQCSKCKDFWPMDSEFFFARLGNPRKDGTRIPQFDAVCKACYEVFYRKRNATRRNHIRSNAERLVTA